MPFPFTNQAFYEKSSSAPRPNGTVFQESQSEEPSEALSLLRGIADCNHLVLFSVQLPIFLDAATISTNSSMLRRLSGAQNLCTLLQNFANTTPISPHLSTVLPEDYGNGEQFQINRSKISIGSTAGQINRAYTSAEVRISYLQLGSIHFSCLNTTTQLQSTYE